MFGEYLQSLSHTSSFAIYWTTSLYYVLQFSDFCVFVSLSSRSGSMLQYNLDGLKICKLCLKSNLYI